MRKISFSTFVVQDFYNSGINSLCFGVNLHWQLRWSKFLVLLLRNKALFEGKWLSAIHHVRLQRCMAEYKLKTTQNIQYFVSYIFTPQKKNKLLVSSWQQGRECCVSWLRFVDSCVYVWLLRCALMFVTGWLICNYICCRGNYSDR